MSEALDNIDDESLAERIQKRDRQAFSCLVERHHQKFYAVAYRMVMNIEEAEDIVQDAFLQLWSKPMIWKKKRGAKFTTWFYRIVVNISIDYLRKKRFPSSVDDMDTLQNNDQTQEQKLVRNEEQKILDRALKTLPENQLAALNLCFYEEITNKEAAEILDVSVKALESLLMRAKANIKKYLYEEDVLKQGDVA